MASEPLDSTGTRLLPGLVLHPDYVHGQPAVELAQLAEGHSFDSVWVPETWGRDAITYLTRLALATSRIRLGPGISPIFNRTPAILAQTIASLDEMTGGRMIVGLGMSAPKVVEDWHGQKFEHPLTRTREYAAILRLALSEKRVNFEGKLFHLRDLGLGFRPVRSSIPIHIAGLAEQNVRLIGEIADGWNPIFLSLPHLDRFRVWLNEGAARVGKASWDGEIAAVVPACVSGNDERDRQLNRAHIAFYVGAMGTYYNRLVTGYGFGDEAKAIREEWMAGRRDQAAAAVNDPMLHDLAISGPAEAARERLTAFQEAGVRPILAPPPGATAEEVAHTIEALS